MGRTRRRAGFTWAELIVVLVVLGVLVGLLLPAVQHTCHGPSNRGACLNNMALPFLGANSWKPASQRDLPGTTPGDYC